MTDSEDYKRIIDRIEKERERQIAQERQLNDQRYSGLESAIERLAKSQEKMSDQFSEFLVTSAGMNEAFRHVSKTVEDHSNWHHEHDKEIQNIKERQQASEKTVSTFTRVAWIAVTAFIGGWITLYFAKYEQENNTAEKLNDLIEVLEKRSPPKP